MSFDIALSGIQAINDQLENISHNIANAGTFGFKSGRANFSSLYAGDKFNGTEVSSISQSLSLQGGTLKTGVGLDASINGRGFFVSKDDQGAMNFTRVGIFTASSDGYLIDGNGRKVQGYTNNGVAGSSAMGALGNLQVRTGQIPAVASTKMEYIGNLDSGWADKTAAGTVTFDSTDPTTYNMSKVSIVYDSLGAQHSLTQYFVKGATPNEVTINYTLDDEVSNAATPGTLVTPATQVLTFNPDGTLLTPTAPVPLTLATTNGSLTPISGTFNVNYAGTTQFDGDPITSTNHVDGYASATFSSVELAEDGSLVAKYTNGEKQTIGTVALATFPNENALTAVNDTSWMISPTSGAPLYGTPGTGMAGALTTGSLEQSNVDITSELVGLMTSQRNYQANSKVISTESAMLQSLMQAM